MADSDSLGIFMPHVDIAGGNARSYSEPVVSICIPTFNGSGTIGATIASCLNQTFNSVEIIISDDNSSDGTVDEISKFDDPRLIVLPPHKSSGAANNWNRTISAANGRYIKVMGQDDLLRPECIQIEVSTLIKNQKLNPSFCFSTRSIIDDSNAIIIQSRGWIPKNNKCSIDETVKQIVRTGGNPIGEPVVGLIDSHALRQTSGYKGSYLIDLNMWLDLLAVGPAVHTQKTLMSFRIGKSSWSFRLKDSQNSEIRAFLKLLKNDYPKLVNKRDVLVGTVLAFLKPKLRVALILIRSKK
jgi:glycosyltransferase involved in cell wall biosynthesis